MGYFPVYSNEIRKKLWSKTMGSNTFYNNVEQAINYMLNFSSKIYNNFYAGPCTTTKTVQSVSLLPVHNI